MAIGNTPGAGLEFEAARELCRSRGEGFFSTGPEYATKTGQNYSENIFLCNHVRKVLLNIRVQVASR